MIVLPSVPLAYPFVLKPQLPALSSPHADVRRALMAPVSALNIMVFTPESRPAEISPYEASSRSSRCPLPPRGDQPSQAVERDGYLRLGLQGCDVCKAYFEGLKFIYRIFSGPLGARGIPAWARQLVSCIERLGDTSFSSRCRAVGAC